ncbi:MAG: DNA polymerase III subunit delta [Prevotella sp.]|nr:DNA polymerase III subunit delta [Prevotella sp.]
MNFNEVIGQEEIKERLMKMCREDRIPHAMMFCGPRGCGKMALAMAFAYYLLEGNFEGSGERSEEREVRNASCTEDFSRSSLPPPPSTENPSTKENPMLATMRHPDLHFTYPTIKLPSMSSDYKPVSDDFAREWHEMIMESPYFTMDRWMQAIGAENQQAIITAGESDALTHKLSLKSSQGGYKVSVIWLPERMNIECANKMLKLIEEPPSRTVFIMVCDEPQRVLETIRSRTQRIDIKRIDDDSMKDALTRRRGLGEEETRRVTRMAAGDWLKAMEIVGADGDNGLFLDMYRTLMRLAYARDIRSMKKWSETVAAFGREKQKRFLDYFLRMTRENFIYNFGRPELNYMTREEEEFAVKFARFVNEKNILQINELANKAIRDISQNANAKIVFFDMALQMIVLLLQK